MAPEPFFGADRLDKDLAQTCLSLYPKVLQAIYRDTRPKLDLNGIIGDDHWRYEELPTTLETSDRLSKAQLARLVKWKITHGTHRPFLPGMIQKNTEAEVQEHTRKAAALITDIHLHKDATTIITAIESALKQVCNLKGVGPATGTLVLSVFQHKLVPFFEDELYSYFHPDHSGKLKYDKAEYKSLLTKALDIVLNKNIDAQVLEKTAYVLMHAGKLGDEAEEQLKGCVDATATHIPVEMPGKNTTKASPTLSKVKVSTDEPGVPEITSKQALKKRKADAQEDEGSVPRRTKRRKA